MRVIVRIVENDSGIIPEFKDIELKRANYQSITIPFKIDPKVFNYEIVKDGKAMIPSLTYKVVDNANWPHEFKLVNVFLDLDKKELTAGQQYATSSNQKISNEPIDYPEFQFSLNFNNGLKDQIVLDKVNSYETKTTLKQRENYLESLIAYIKTDDLLWDFSYVENLIDKLEDQEIEKLMTVKIQ